MVKDEKYPKYPTWESIEKENQEAKPAVYLEIKDASGNFVNRVAGKAKKGLHRVTWDMTYGKTAAVVDGKLAGSSLVAPPGKYNATLYKRVGSTVTQLAAPVDFELQAIYESALKTNSSSEVLDYGRQVVDAQKRSSAARTVIESVEKTMSSLRIAIDGTPNNIAVLEKQFADIQAEINAINFELYGLKSRDRKGVKPANISSRLDYAMSASWSNYGPTKQHKEQFGYALEGLDMVTKRIKTLEEDLIPALQKAIIDAGGPWTKGASL